MPLLCVSILLPFVFGAVASNLFSDDAILPFYINVVMSAYVVLLLSRLKAEPRWMAIDKYLGNLSYPVFLCHFNVAIVVLAVLGEPAKASDGLLMISIGPIILTAYAINRWVEQTIGYGYDQRRKTTGKLLPGKESLPVLSVCSRQGV